MGRPKPRPVPVSPPPHPTDLPPRGCPLSSLIVDATSNDRPARPGALAWADAFELGSGEAPGAVLPYDVDDLHPEVVDGEARYLSDPIVRLCTAGWEVLGGHRRCWAALLAGAGSIRCREVLADDAQADVYRYQDNARAELGPLAEARALERVRVSLSMRAMSSPRAPVAEVAAAVGQPEAHVARRLLLLDAIEPVQAALAAQQVVLEVVLFFARRPTAEQAHAWPRAEEHARAEGGPVRLDHFVRRLFQALPLARASWPLEAQVDGARPCVGCPRRSDAQISILTEPDADAECLDATCYESKREASQRARVELAVAHGARVLTGAEARAAVPLSPGDATGYVDLDEASPILDAAHRPLTWRMVLPAEILETLAPEARAVAEVGDGARELVRVAEAQRAARGRLGENAAPEAREALDAWAKLQRLNATETRSTPPEPAPLPKAKAPGKASEREAKKTAKAEAARAKLLAAIRAVPPPVSTLAGWALRLASDDTREAVAEALGVSTGYSLDIEAADREPHAVLALVLTVQLLVVGGESAELAAQAAAVAPKKTSKKASRTEDEDDVPAGEDELVIDEPSGELAKAEEPAAEPCPIDEAAVDRLAAVAKVLHYSRGACSPVNVWGCSSRVFALVEAAHPVEVSRGALFKALGSTWGEDAIDIACALLLGERKLHRTGGKSGSGWKYSLKQPGLPQGEPPAVRKCASCAGVLDTTDGSTEALSQLGARTGASVLRLDAEDATRCLDCGKLVAKAST